MSISDELSARERDVLSAVERRLTNPEIAAEYHISLRTVESHIAALRRKLNATSRTALVSAARRRRTGHVSLPRNSFVGRADDVGAVRRGLDRGRWVTVIGPAGCGKTRLALEIAGSDQRIPIVCELDDAAADDVAAAVAGALGLPSPGRDVVTACAVALATHRYLLVLDNCDRVTEPTAALVERWLTAVGSLAVLATSRSPLGGAGEHLHELAPLPVDGPAVRLFLDRSGVAGDAEPELVQRICRRLDGLPLAIELAAARVRLLPLRELADHLDTGFDALTRGGSGRHRTLQSAVEWSWDLLGADEQALLGRLAALPSPFDLAIVEAVAGRPAAATALRLVDRSLVSVGPIIGGRRTFRLLESVRAFATSRTDPGVADEVRDRHARHLVEQIGAISGKARTDPSRAAAEESLRVCAAAASALDWLVAKDDPVAATLARDIGILIEQYSPTVEALSAIDRAARSPAVRAAAGPEDLDAIGQALCFGDLDLVKELANVALGKDQDHVASRHLAALAAAYRHERSEALAHLDAAERLADPARDGWILASCSQTRGILLHTCDPVDPAGALAAYRTAIEQFGAVGDATHVNNCRYHMAMTATAGGVPTADALGWADACAAFATESGNQHELAHALLARATLAPPDSEAEITEMVEIFRGVGDLRCLTRCYLLLADRAGNRQVIHLEQALAVTRAANDLENQVMVLERLIDAHWASGAHRLAVVTVGELAGVIGRDRALARCSDDVLAELGRWDGALAEGLARISAERASP